MNPPSHDRQPQALTADTRPPSHDVQNFTCNMALPEKLHMKHEFHIWDSTKNSPNYETWGRNFGAMVRQQPHGGDVQDLFEHLAGVSWGRHERPQFLSDPRLARTRPAAASSSETELQTPTRPNSEDGQPALTAGATPTANPTPREDTGQQTGQLEPKRIENYYDLSEESQKLDKLLYGALCSVVTGTKSTIIASGAGCLSYIESMLALHKHLMKNRLERCTNAITSMMELTYRGDPNTWEIEANTLTLELKESGATIRDVMFAAMHRSIRKYNAVVAHDMHKLEEHGRKTGDLLAIEDHTHQASAMLLTTMAGSKPVNFAETGTQDAEELCRGCRKVNWSKEHWQVCPGNKHKNRPNKSTGRKGDTHPPKKVNAAKTGLTTENLHAEIAAYLANAGVMPQVNLARATPAQQQAHLAASVLANSHQCNVAIKMETASSAGSPPSAHHTHEGHRLILLGQGEDAPQAAASHTASPPAAVSPDTRQLSEEEQGLAISQPTSNKSSAGHPSAPTLNILTERERYAQLADATNAESPPAAVSPDDRQLNQDTHSRPREPDAPCMSTAEDPILDSGSARHFPQPLHRCFAREYLPASHGNMLIPCPERTCQDSPASWDGVQIPGETCTPRLLTETERMLSISQSASNKSSAAYPPWPLSPDYTPRVGTEAPEGCTLPWPPPDLCLDSTSRPYLVARRLAGEGYTAQTVADVLSDLAHAEPAEETPESPDWQPLGRPSETPSIPGDNTSPVTEGEMQSLPATQEYDCSSPEGEEHSPTDDAPRQQQLRDMMAALSRGNQPCSLNHHGSYAQKAADLAELINLHEEPGKAIHMQDGWTRKLTISQELVSELETCHAMLPNIWGVLYEASLSRNYTLEYDEPIDFARWNALFNMLKHIQAEDRNASHFYQLLDLNHPNKRRRETAAGESSQSPDTTSEREHMCLLGTGNAKSSRMPHCSAPGITDGTWVSLFAGYDGLAYISQLIGVHPARYLAVESAEHIRRASDLINEKTSTFCGIERPCHSVMEITEEMVKSWGPLALVGSGPCCGDFSFCKEGPPRYPGQEVGRKGLNGRTGRLFRQLITILGWVLKHNPQCTLFTECVVFDDMTDDWNEVCAALGQPHILNAKDFSYTRRHRAYWTRNLDLPEDFGALEAPNQLDPNDMMDSGRVLIPRSESHPHGPGNVNTIAGSWSGDPQQPKANTVRPVMVRDDRCTEPQHLRVAEAERLLGLPGEWTAPAGTARDRMRLIGSGWDINVVRKFLEHYREQVLEKQTTCMHTQTLARALTPGPHHIFKRRTDEQVLLLIGYENTLPLRYFKSLLESIAPSVLQRFFEVQKHKSYLTAQRVKEDPILDSGSARHISDDVTVTNEGDQCTITGVHGYSQLTEGTGTMQLQPLEHKTGRPATLKVGEVDKMKVSATILSLGLLLRDGYEFELKQRGEHCIMRPPAGPPLQIRLCSDNIIRIPLHTTHAALAAQATRHFCMGATKEQRLATSKYIHMTLNHASRPVIEATLKHTTGCSLASSLVDFTCKACAQANARYGGLSHKKVAFSMQCNRFLCCTQQGGVDDGSDDEPPSDDNAEADIDFTQHAAPLPGKGMGTKPLPRFRLEALRPMEAHFLDNKEIDGGYLLFFVDMKSRATDVVFINSKTANGRAYKEICARWGIHKLGYKCVAYTDGCGSMKYVRDAAIDLGIDHQFIPPHEQSLNEAEKVVDRMLAAARTHMVQSGAPEREFEHAVTFAVYTRNRMATDEKRGMKTPLEICGHGVPCIKHLKPFYTPCSVMASKEQRASMASAGDPFSRARAGRLLTFSHVHTKLYTIRLDKGKQIVGASSRRCKFDLSAHFEGESRRTTQGDLSSEGEGDTSHSITDTFDFSGIDPFNTTESTEQITSAEDNSEEEEDEGDALPETPPPPSPSSPELPHSTPDSQSGHDWGPPPEPRTMTREAIQLHRQNQEFDGPAWKPPARQGSNHCLLWQPPRRDHLAYTVMKIIDSNLSSADQDTAIAAVMTAQEKPDIPAILDCAHYFAGAATRSLNWGRTLRSPDADKAVEAYKKELKSLQDTVLTLVLHRDSDYEQALQEACEGRFLLNIKRNGRYKARGVKMGNLEDRILADGANFCYQAHVAALSTVRMAVFRSGRTGRSRKQWRRLALQDISTAFLQSHQYAEGKFKYVKFYDPLTGKTNYYRQTGPIYGEASAPIRWEDTIAPWFEKQGMIRGANEPCVFRHPEKDLLIILYVDDVMFDGKEEDIIWMSEKMSAAFKCTELEWLSDDNSLDHLGVEIIIQDDRIHMCMENYITKVAEALGMTQSKPAQRPIIKEIDATTRPLTAAERKRFLTAVGCAGWAASTVRLDCAYAHSRIAQHMANPTISALEAIETLIRYLITTAKRSISTPLTPPTVKNEWNFYTDSDHAGNKEEVNGLCSQSGMVTTLNEGVANWFSKKISVCTATPLMKDTHAEFSSAGSEIMAMGNGSHEFLHTQYKSEEMGLNIEFPITIQVDNAAAELFARGTVRRTKLKHLDQRQQWIKDLKDAKLFTSAHVDTKLNKADLMTKILPLPDFVSQCNLCMTWLK